MRRYGGGIFVRSLTLAYAKRLFPDSNSWPTSHQGTTLPLHQDSPSKTSYPIAQRLFAMRRYEGEILYQNSNVQGYHRYFFTSTSLLLLWIVFRLILWQVFVQIIVILCLQFILRGCLCICYIATLIVVLSLSWKIIFVRFYAVKLFNEVACLTKEICGCSPKKLLKLHPYICSLMLSSFFFPQNYCKLKFVNLCGFEYQNQCMINILLANINLYNDRLLWIISYVFASSFSVTRNFMLNS